MQPGVGFWGPSHLRILRRWGCHGMASRARCAGKALRTHFPPPAPPDRFLGVSISSDTEQSSSSPCNTVEVPTKAHGSSSRHLLDVVQVVWGEAAGVGPGRGALPPTMRLLAPTYLPLETGWPPFCRRHSHCRSSPSPGCPSASAQRERSCGHRVGGKRSTLGPGQRGAEPPPSPPAGAHRPGRSASACTVQRRRSG